MIKQLNLIEVSESGICERNVVEFWFLQLQKGWPKEELQVLLLQLIDYFILSAMTKDGSERKIITFKVRVSLLFSESFFSEI